VYAEARQRDGANESGSGAEVEPWGAKAWILEQQRDGYSDEDVLQREHVCEKPSTAARVVPLEVERHVSEDEQDDG
jgi:hypothetical protein